MSIGAMRALYWRGVVVVVGWALLAAAAAHAQAAQSGYAAADSALRNGVP